MLKNKFKLIAILMVVILAIFVPFSNAADDDVMPISTDDDQIVEGTLVEDGSDTIIENPEDHSHTEVNYKESDVYLFEDNVVIDYVIDGNLFVMAKSVTIDASIGGDAFIFADNITITENGYVYSNLFSISNSLNIQGVVYDVYSISQTIDISGYIYRDLRISSSSVNILGVIGRNAFVECSNLSFTQETSNATAEGENTLKGMINGNLSYSAKSEIEIPEGSVAGTTDFTQANLSTNTKTVQDYLIALGTSLVSIIILWLLCLWLAPKFLENSSNLLAHKPLPAFGLGILGIILVPIVFIILLFLELTAYVSFLLILLYILVLCISSAIFTIALNNLICSKLKISKNIGIFGMLIVTSIVIWALELIPVVGGIISFLVCVLGLGILTAHLVFKKNTEKTDTNETTK